MILSNILLGALVLFFAIRLFLAIRETKQKRPKIRLFSKTTGEVVELNMTDAVKFLTDIPADFTQQAKFIFLRVTEAFAKGRLNDVKGYLGQKVFPVFQEVISKRESLGQTMDFSIIGFKDVKVVANSENQKVISFTTEQVNLLKDKDNNVIEGDPLYVATVTENWTFSKKKENTWIVTGIENKEAHFA